MVSRSTHIAGSLRAVIAAWGAPRSVTRIGAGSLVLGAVVVAFGAPGASSAATSSASSPRDGYYAPLSADSGANVNDNQHASAALELFVIDKGKQVDGKGFPADTALREAGRTAQEPERDAETTSTLTYRQA